jgi:hypothetical protein
VDPATFVYHGYALAQLKQETQFLFGDLSSLRYLYSELFVLFGTVSEGTDTRDSAIAHDVKDVQVFDQPNRIMKGQYGGGDDDCNRSRSSSDP